MLKDCVVNFKVSKKTLTIFLSVCRCLPAQMSFDSLYAGAFYLRYNG